jgi:transposase
MDAHKRSISVAVLPPGSREPIEWQVLNRTEDIRRLARKLVRMAAGGEVRCCYEAGPCGFALKRELEAAAPLVCEVIAPSLIPIRPGERVKTDRRDARKLARLLRAGELTEVHPPSEAEEAVRDLVRCREDIREDLLRCRHRLAKLLLRRGRIYSGHAWTQAHRQWLRSLAWEQGADQVVFDDYLRAVELLEDRLRGLNAEVEAIAAGDTYRKPVGWLRCFYGIDTVTAMAVLAELYNLDRFERARDLMSYVGLVSREHSSGEQRRRGGITKSGNAHVRRVLVEAAHHYRRRPHVAAKLRHRREGQPGWAIAYADRAHARLHRRFSALSARGKPTGKVVVAVARELVGFLWAVVREGTQREQIRQLRQVGTRVSRRARPADAARAKRRGPAQAGGRAVAPLRAAAGRR